MTTMDAMGVKRLPIQKAPVDEHRLAEFTHGGPTRGVAALARAKNRVPPAPPRYKKEKPENIRWVRDWKRAL
jgi:hypothetical protein